MNPESYFNLDDTIIHVNHAAVAPWPIRTVDAVKQFADENGRIGSKRYGDWLQIESQLREHLAELINAPSADDIALLKNTSEGLSVIAFGLDWGAGNNIVIAEDEFPSNRIVWEALKPQGVEIRLVQLDPSNPEQSMIEQIDDQTRLLSISAVQYANGMRMDLQSLSSACRAQNVLFCVDAIQQIGALDFDSQLIQADFVVADGHKWMLGPEGLALFYCRKELRSQLKLQQFGWHMVEDVSDFSKMDHWQPAESARRFECGSPNMLAIHALNASVEVLLEVGMDKIEQQVLDNVQFLITHLSTFDDIEILSPTERHRHAGIFTFRKKSRDSAQLYNELVAKGVICAPRGGGIRLSPHFYTSRTQLTQLIDWIIKY